MNLCKYKDILGMANKGFHTHGVVGFAYLDLIGTVIISYLLSFITRYKTLYIFLFLFFMSIVLHRVFCVDTVITKMIF